MPIREKELSRKPNLSKNHPLKQKFVSSNKIIKKNRLGQFLEILTIIIYGRKRKKKCKMKLIYVFNNN